jgi:hypothetical protein
MVEAITAVIAVQRLRIPEGRNVFREKPFELRASGSRFALSDVICRRRLAFVPRPPSERVMKHPQHLPGRGGGRV